jgi:hypothetical protein
MEIKELLNRTEPDPVKKHSRLFGQFNFLLAELRKKELPDEVVMFINHGIERTNSARESSKAWRKELRRNQSNILTKIEKELKLVTKYHYRNRWMAIGMAAFGVPLGVAFGTSLGNMAFIGIGLPIGLAIGIAVGSDMDKKAFKEGRMLDVEI